MPIVTGRDFWEAYLGSEGRWLGRTRAQLANDGIYPLRNAQEEPITWNNRWDKKAFTMTTADGVTAETPLVKEHTIGEILKHTHNPRGLNAELSPPLPFFQKSLPQVGEQNLWVRTSDNDWSVSYAAQATIENNDESTVYFRTIYGLQGYICSCHYCKLSWDVKSHQSWVTEARYQQENYDIRGLGYQQRYIGHLGAIARAIRMGLQTVDGLSSETFYYINTLITARSRGLLERRVNDLVSYAVPKFVENEPDVTIGPPEPQLSAADLILLARQQAVPAIPDPPIPHTWYPDPPEQF